MNQRLEKAKESIRDVIDFPKKGIVFKDITTLLKDQEHLQSMIEYISQEYMNRGITKVVGLESRGFILGAAVAYKIGAGFVPIRKPGKLPAEVYSERYSLEYGEDEIQIHRDALNTEDVVLLHDDLLATGGTACASLELLERCGVKDIFCNFMVELDFLKGRDKLGSKYDVNSIFHF